MKKNLKHVLFVAVLSLLLALVGCSSGKNTTEPTQPDTGSDTTNTDPVDTPDDTPTDTPEDNTPTDTDEGEDQKEETPTSDPTDSAEATFPEYKLAHMASYELDGQYYYAFTLEMVNAGDSLSSIDIYVDDELTYSYMQYFGDVCVQHEYTYDHPDCEQITFLLHNDSKIDVKKVTFEADYYDSNVKKSIEDEKMTINAKAADITTKPEYVHGSNIFEVNGTYVIWNYGSDGTSNTMMPYDQESRTYEFVPLANEADAKKAMKSFVAGITLLGSADDQCAPFEYAEGESLYTQYEGSWDGSYTVWVGGQITGAEFTDEAGARFDKTNFMFTAKDGSTMKFYNLQH